MAVVPTYTGEIVRMTITVFAGGELWLDARDADSANWDGTFTGDNEIEANLEIGRVRWQTSGSNVSINRTGASTAEFRDARDAGGSLNGLYVHVSHDSTTEVFTSAQITATTSAGGGFINFPFSPSIPQASTGDTATLVIASNELATTTRAAALTASAALGTIAVTASALAQGIGPGAAALVASASLGTVTATASAEAQEIGAGSAALVASASLGTVAATASATAQESTSGEAALVASASLGTVAATASAEASHAAPMLSVDASATSVNGGQTITLTGSAIDPDHALDDLRFVWSAEGGTFTDTRSLTTDWTAPPATPEDQTFNLVLTVIDPDGNTDTSTTAVTVPKLQTVAERIDFDGIKGLLVSQWSESPRLMALQDEILALIREQLVEPLAALERMANLDTAEGVWLDYIGARLGEPRPAVISTDFMGFGFDDIGDSESEADDDVSFDQGPMASTLDALTPRVSVGDDYYRCVLEMRARALLGAGTVGALEAMAGCVAEDYRVVDNQDMTATVHVTPNAAEQNIVDVATNTFKKAVPAGVAVTIMET